jgi:hypothetical protein
LPSIRLAPFCQALRCAFTLMASSQDTRIGTPRWVAQRFQDGRKSGLSDHEIIRLALAERYPPGILKPMQAEVLASRMDEPQDIFALCHLIADLENLAHLSLYQRRTVMIGEKTIEADTFDVMDRELCRLGYDPDQPSAMPAAPVPASSRRARLAICVLVACAIIAGAVFAFTRFGGSKLLPSPEPTSAASPEPAGTSSPPPAKALSPELANALSPELAGWYERLREERAQLDLSNAEAVTVFNQHVAVYHEALERARHEHSVALPPPPQGSVTR